VAAAFLGYLSCLLFAAVWATGIPGARGLLVLASLLLLGCVAVDIKRRRLGRVSALLLGLWLATGLGLVVVEFFGGLR